jgi:hypothetical protein
LAQNFGYGSNFGKVTENSAVGIGKFQFSWKQFQFRLGKFQSCVQNFGHASKFGKVMENSVPVSKISSLSGLENFRSAGNNFSFVLENSNPACKISVMARNSV